MKKFFKEKYLLAFIIFLLTITMYTVRLDFLPYSFHGDEAETALQALQLMKGKIGFIGVGWYDLPLLSFVPHAVGMIIFGENIVGDRIGSVLFGLLTLPVFFVFVKNMYTQRISIIATVLLATSHIWISLSRVGITYIQATFLVVCCLYFVTKGIKKNDYINFFIGGIFLGLCLYSYYAARLVFLLIPFVIISFSRNIDLKKRCCQIIILMVTTFLVFAPQGKFFLQHPQSFNSRVHTVYIFSNSQKEWRQREYPNKTNIEIIFFQFKKTLDIFSGDTSGQYGFKGQLFDYATLLLFSLGIVYTSLSFKRHILIIAWLIGSLLLGQVLTTSPAPIFLPRFVVGLPVFFVFCALGSELLFKIFKKQEHIVRYAVTILLMIMYIINLKVYFITYPNQLNNGIAGDVNALNATTIAYYIHDLPTSYEAIFLTKPNLYADFSTLRFLSPQHTKISSDVQSENVLGASTETPFSVENKVYILYPNQQDILYKLRNKYINGTTIEYQNSNKKTQFFIYKIKP